MRSPPYSHSLSEMHTVKADQGCHLVRDWTGFALQPEDNHIGLIVARYDELKLSRNLFI